MASRFQMEISGMLDAQIALRDGKANTHFWENRAIQQVRDAVVEAHTKATVDSKGVIRWKSNNKCVPDDFCEMLEYAGFNFNRQATKEASDEETRKFFEEYRKAQQNHKYSAEELFEMEAAFGKGAVVVDVITGKKIRL